MIDKIKQFLGFNSVKSLQTKSESILDVFNKTAVDLDYVNSQISTEVSNRDLQIEKLEKEQVDLNSIKSANQKIIDKIHTFLS